MGLSKRKRKRIAMSLHLFTEQWWDGKLADPVSLSEWLVRLREAEWGGAKRFQQIVDRWKPTGDALAAYLKIIDDELRHKLLVEMVLASRSIAFSDAPSNKPERYWEPVWQGVSSFETACAAGAYGEMLALNRFRVIHSHEDTPDDIRLLVGLILPDEKRHAKELHALAGDAAMNAVRPFHELGKQALGITVPDNH